MRILLWVCGLFCIGHIAVLWLHPWLMDLFFYLFLLGGTICTACTYKVIRHFSFYQLTLRILGLACIGFGIGGLHGFWQLDKAVAQKLPQLWHGETMVLEGRVVSFPNLTAEKVSFQFKPSCGFAAQDACVPLARLKKQGHDFPDLERIKVSLYATRSSKMIEHHSGLTYFLPPIQPGETLRLQLKLKPPRGLANLYGFDYGRWLMEHKIHALASGRLKCFGEGVCQRLAGPTGLWQARLSISETLSSLFGDFPTAERFLNALWIADKTGLDQKTQEAFSDLGLSHLLAISGLHIGMVGAIGYFFGQYFCLLLGGQINRARLLGGLMSILFALVYASLAGFSLPTLRALLMLVIAVLYLNLKGEISFLPLLVWGLTLSLLFQPMSPLGLGFWLSFSAILFLALIFSARRPQYSFLAGLMLAQCLLGLGLSLFLLPNQGWNPVSFFANLMMIPLLQFIVMPITLLLMLLNATLDILSLSSWVGFVAFPVGWVLQNVLELLVYAADHTSVLMFGGNWGRLSTIAAGISLVLVFVSKLRLAIYLVPIFLAIAFLNRVERPDWGQAYVSLLDVGQGLAIVVETHSHSLVYDAGARYSSGWDAGEVVLLPYLRRRSIRQLDRLVVSHMDNDHSGGVKSLLKKLVVNSIMLPPNVVPLEAWSNGEANAGGRFGLSGSKQPIYEECTSGESWEWDGVSFEIISPLEVRMNGLAFDRWDGNNASCVLKVVDNERSYLFPGDIESEVEQVLLETALSDLKSDVLIAPHHGSKTSSGTGWINAIQPKFVVFSAGFKNRYGHPDPNIVKRYVLRDIETISTSVDGAVHWKDAKKPLLIRRHFDYAWY